VQGTCGRARSRSSGMFRHAPVGICLDGTERRKKRKMSKYAIEIENIKKGVTVITAGHVIWNEGFTAQGEEYTYPTMSGIEAQGPLVMASGDDERPSVAVLTSEQFSAYAHDIACFSGPHKGCPKSLALYLRDLKTGVREPVKADIVLEVIESGLSADKYAAKVQADAQEALEKAAAAQRKAEAGEGEEAHK
jgi:hypothetical protein